MSPDEFVPSPSGEIDYGEITPEMGKAMRRQAGKIRLQRGDATFGLQHIEERHGKEIRNAGFASVQEFVANIAKNIDQVWKPGATSQLVALHAVKNDRVMFIQLQAASDGSQDFYTVNTAFPSRPGYVSNKKNWKMLWEGRAQPSQPVTSKQAPFAESPQKAGKATTIPAGQSDASVPAQDAQAQSTPQQPEDAQKLTPDEAKELMEWQSLGAKDGVTKHILTFYESKADKDAKRGRMIVATVTKGGRSATAWMVDGDDQTFGPLSLAKKRGMEIGMSKAVADGFVEAAPAQQEAQQNSDDRAKPEPVAPIASKVDDFGEKLPPARRAMAAKLSEELTDDAIASQPLSKVWPLEENEAIEDTFAAAVAHVMREAVPAKPRTSYKVKSWVSKVKVLRDFAAKILRGTVTKDIFLTELAKYNSLRDLGAKIKLLEQIDRAQWKRIGDVSEAPGAITYVDGKAVPQPSASVTVDGKSHWFRNSGDINNHLDAIKAMLTGDAPESKLKFDVFRATTGDRKVFISKKGDKEYRRLMEFDTVEEARKALGDQYADLVAAWEGVKSRDNITERDLRTAENRPRTGKDHRQGRDVSAEEFQQTFGFRGGEFGKWVSQGNGAQERQFMLNSAYDALMDLSDIIGVPPKAISLDGTLGVAFGSRGGGWASAHFEPSNLVINLTKPRGAGALAHEWFHALDNYFARKRGGEVPIGRSLDAQNEYRRNNFITHKTRPMMVRKDGKGSPVTRERLAEWRKSSPGSAYLNEDQWIEDPNHKPGVRAEVEERFDELVKALDASPMLKRARKIDGVKLGDGYWSRTLERAARAFENYIQVRMNEQGYHNDFLVNVKPAVDVGKNLDRYPYLLPSEVAPIADAFSNLFNTIQTKEEDGKTVMFSRRSASGNRVPDVVIGHKLGDLNRHPDYEAAKAGDSLAAARIATDLVDDAFVQRVREAAGDADVIVPVVSVEATGRNKIPAAVADLLAEKLGSDAEAEIVQANSPKRTAMDGLDRLLSPPVFEGPVRNGAAYVLVDDTVTQGGTFASLASHIRDNGGRVAGLVALTGKQYSSKLSPSPELLSQVRDRFSDIESQFRAATGYGFDALTESEARYLIKHDDAQRVRDRIIAAGNQAGNERDAGVPPRASRSQVATGGLSPKTAQQVVDAIRSRWANAPEVVVVSGMQDQAVPQRVRDADLEQRSMGATGEPEGFWYGGKVYIVASALKSPRDVIRVLFHESLGHYGLQGVFGDGLKPILQQIAALRRAEVVAKAREYGLVRLNADGSPSVDMDNATDKDVWAAMDEQHKLYAAEEVLAVMAQTRPDMGYVKRAVAAIRAWLRKNVPMFKDMELADAEIIQQYILPARRFVEQGARAQAPGQAAVAFSQGGSNALAELARADDLFAVPKSDKTSFEDILAELAPGAQVKKITNIPGRVQFNITLPDQSTARVMQRPHNPYGETVYGFDLDENGEMMNMQVGRPGENPEDVGAVDDVWIDVSLLNPGSKFGEIMYSAAANYAHNTGRIFIGDPAGLSDEALRRRTEQMISSALKFGTTEHLAPHPRQTAGSEKLGVPALKWVYGDHVGNIERMIDVSLRSLENAGLDLGKVAYDPQRETFIDTATGVPVPRGTQLAALANANGMGGRGSERPAGGGAVRQRGAGQGQAGWRTVARAALFSYLKSTISVESGAQQRGGLLDRLRDVSTGLGREPSAGGDYPASQRIFYSRSQGGVDEEAAFSRTSPAGIQKAIIEAVPEGVLQRLEDLTASQRGFNRWWHRTVGTQLHKAKTNKEFGRVFYAVQDFMKDTSRMATIAADQAPDLLPQVDSLKDVQKLLPQMVNTKARRADLKAASDALFDGTLRYTRNEVGQAVEVEPDSEEPGGLVWTDAELRARGMNEKAIALYRQAREAINQSMDNLLAADVYRMMTAMKPEMLAGDPGALASLMDKVRRTAASDEPRKAVSLALRALDAQGAQTLAQIRRLRAQVDSEKGDRTPTAFLATNALKRATDLMNQIEQARESMQTKIDRVAELQARGYAPLMRFGPYTVDVVDPDGTRVFFGMYETQFAANRAARRFREQGLVVSQGVKSQREFELLKGVSPETAMLFADMLGIEKNDVMQAWLQNALAEQSALKRHIRRKGIEGFDDDASRVVAAFLTSNSRAGARALHGLRIQEFVENVREGDVKDEAIALAQYVDNPREEAQAVRSLLFVNYIGGSIASALVNLTQTLVQTFPYLAQFGGAPGAARRLAGAMKLALGKIEDPDLAEAVLRAERDGVIKPQEVFQLQAEASRSLGSDLRVRAGLALWGSFFQAAEVFNRRVAFIAAYQTAKDRKISNPFAFAENAVDETQGVFNKGNRPNWARGAVGATIFTFKTFTVQYVEFLKRLPPKERALALAVLVLLAGFRGLPFAEDAEDVLDTVAQALGYNFTTKQQMDQFLVATLGKPFADFLQHGASGTGLLPFDVSQRLGMADLLPATGILKPSETKKEDQVLEIFGVAGSFVRDYALKGLPKYLSGDVEGALQARAAPSALVNAYMGWKMYADGIYTDTRGRKVMDVGPMDAAMKTIGLQPAGVAEESRKARSAFEMRSLFNKVKGEISEQMALGQFEGDKEKIQAARDRLADWNAKNPEAKMVLNGQAIRKRVTEMRRDRAERLIRSTPKELRAAVRETME